VFWGEREREKERERERDRERETDVRYSDNRTDKLSRVNELELE
jgi:hypothetical protein